ncbi:MAG: DNA alkylation repair protein [Vicinamibacterales bacterium]
MARSTFDREARLIQALLAPLGTPQRAAGSKAYLKSDLRFLGNDTATLRQEARAWRAGHADWDIDALCGLTDALWRRGVFELRSFALVLLVTQQADLGPRHLPFLERLLRDSHTWALVDEIAPRLVGSLLSRHPREAGRVLDRWATDADFWIRRAAILSLLLPMRRGAGDWKRFERYADPLLADREFFIRKAIGWVLREAVKAEPERVVAYVAPRAGRLSGVTWREATRKLPASARRQLAARRAGAEPKGR